MAGVHFKAVATLLLAAMLAAGAADAAEPSGPPPDAKGLVTDAFVADAKKWAFAPLVVSALEARNARHGILPPDRIAALDAQWRAEREADLQPLITSVLTGPVSSYLTRIQARSVGLFTEIFLMDRNGLNLGQSSITTDFWQGDEAKFQKTFDVGAGAVFLDEAEFHAGTATWRAQVSLTVVDAAGRPAGAVTIEVNLTELERRAGARTTS